MGFDLDLVEFHSLQICSYQTDSTRSREIYGTIRIEDGLGDIDIFKQERDSPILTSQDGTLTAFPGMVRCIKGVEFFLVLSLKERREDPDQDVEVCHGNFELTTGSRDGFWLRKRVHASFPGEVCYSVLNFTIIKNAMEATVEAVLITNGDNRKSSHIHGSLTARNSDLKYDSKYDAKFFTSVLFDVPRDKAIEAEVIKPSEIEIPLSRKVVGVPTYANLSIQVDLWWENEGISEPHLQVVSGTVSFLANSDASKTVTGFIPGEDARIQVTVTWRDKEIIDHLFKMMRIALVKLDGLEAALENQKKEA